MNDKKNRRYTVYRGQQDVVEVLFENRLPGDAQYMMNGWTGV